jgi:hypothetical protein
VEASFGSPVPHINERMIADALIEAGLVPGSRHGGRNPEESAARRFLDAGAFVATNPTNDSITSGLS